MEDESTLLMIPGPVQVLPRILRAMSRPMIGHRSREFGRIYEECQKTLKELFQTANDIFVMSGSGTCAMEAAVGNIIGRNDTVVTIENGKFGERFRLIAERYGKVKPVTFEWGTSIELDKVEDALSDGAKAVTMVHNETSTGIKNNVKEISKLVHQYDALFIMDGVTSIGGDTVLVDEWGVDIALVGSQKCLGAPPGLSAISVSDAARDAIVDQPPYYADLNAYRKSSVKEITQTPYTPAVSLFCALEEALNVINEEGIDTRRKRHKMAAAAIRAAAEALEIESFPSLNKISEYSNTVTAMFLPEGINDKKLRDGMLKRKVQISGGQEHLSGSIFRIGAMGNFTERDILTTIQTLEVVLKEYHVITRIGDGVDAASDVFSSSGWKK
ncbi:MAG: alanine--glyoxylate aminotransferase family protein [Methanosarcinales archaeon]|nr:MAG: alanine--glyoxylate aminotransferase family protein [Methanosarcinales archaeon]